MLTIKNNLIITSISYTCSVLIREHILNWFSCRWFELLSYWCRL